MSLDSPTTRITRTHCRSDRQDVRCSITVESPTGKRVVRSPVITYGISRIPPSELSPALKDDQGPFRLVTLALDLSAVDDLDDIGNRHDWSILDHHPIDKGLMFRDME